MRIELRVCKHCFDGEHNDPHKTAVTRDMVTCAERIRQHKENINLQAVAITMVEEGEVEGAQELPAFVASLHDDQVRITDTQLVMEDPQGNLLVYPELADMLDVLVGNLQEVDEATPGNVMFELSPESADLLS